VGILRKKIMALYNKHHRQIRARILNRICIICNTKLLKAVNYYGWECPFCRETYGENWFLEYEEYMDNNSVYGYPNIKELRKRRLL
jgi:hypothetical protein